MQKDYWNTAKKNFRILGFVSSFLAIGYLFSFLSLQPVFLESVFIKWFLMLEGLFLVTAVMLFIIASLFKKHSPKAIVVGYAYLSILLVLDLINYFVLSSPSDFLNEGVAYKLLSFLILGYLFMNVYKASKQGIIQPQL